MHLEETRNLFAASKSSLVQRDSHFSFEGASPVMREQHLSGQPRLLQALVTVLVLSHDPLTRQAFSVLALQPHCY